MAKKRYHVVNETVTASVVNTVTLPTPSDGTGISSVIFHATDAAVDLHEESDASGAVLEIKADTNLEFSHRHLEGTTWYFKAPSGGANCALQILYTTGLLS